MKEPLSRMNFFLGWVKRQAAADLLQSLLCQSVGLQTQIHWSCSTLQWAILQDHYSWRWANDGSQKCSALYHSCICRSAAVVFLRNILIMTKYYSKNTGQQRSRMLATLFKDERCQTLPAYSILEKMYLDRIIRRSELTEFENLLLPHQKAAVTDSKYRKYAFDLMNFFE